MRCPDCNVEPGQLHVPGCDIERCPRCHCQAIGCDCIYVVNGINPDTMDETHPDIYKNGATDQMWDKFDKEYGAKRICWESYSE